MSRFLLYCLNSQRCDFHTPGTASVLRTCFLFLLFLYLLINVQKVFGIQPEPQLGAWNWWKDEDSRIPRYVYQDGTVAITMQIDRVSYQDLGGQWCPIPEPREPKE